jgi:uncharacterized protein YpuA (DUF1002 family)
MSNVKILLTYTDDENNYQIESVWAIPTGNYYKIDNIPLFASNIALGDIVSVEKEGEELHFKKLIKRSGNSVIQMIIFKEKNTQKVGKDFENLGCNLEGSHIKNLIAIDIPKNIDYKKIKKDLDNGVKHKLWSYKEACLAH